jgi:hypothetical protein
MRAKGQKSLCFQSSTMLQQGTEESDSASGSFLFP